MLPMNFTTRIQCLRRPRRVHTSLVVTGIGSSSGLDLGLGSLPHNDSQAAANAVLSFSSRDSSTRAVICVIGIR